MSESISDAPSADSEKPVHDNDTTIKFPPFPDPTDEDFDEDLAEEERSYYKIKFSDLNSIRKQKLHCTACDRHLGCSARNEARMRTHPMLRTLMCHTCHTFYNSGEFEKGDDGSELYCRWCGQGGQVYCCSDCPHVFCAKCIRRNFGNTKIKEIENIDDWKCFKCNPRCLWDLRAICWALLRYCDLKNKIAYNTTDQELRESYQIQCTQDNSECCKVRKKKEKDVKKKEPEVAKKATTTPVIPKLPPTIQVKKFASITPDDSSKEKKPQKRPASPRSKPLILKTPVTVNRVINPVSLPPIAKKIRMPNAMPPVRFQQKNFINTYQRLRPKTPQMPQMTILSTFNSNNFNGFNNPAIMVANDNINLSLESLTQGLDMSAVVGMAGDNNDVVCTPDFPLEPLCEVTEDNNDDDVQCITPAPAVAPVVNTPPPLVPRFGTINDLNSDNIIQMTENDVTVNAATGGLKFRVDPQTLSSNKMYRLPDGRIFAINANTNMPGGYSATIVAVTENSTGKVVPKGSTYAAKLSTVTVPNTSSNALPPKQTRMTNTPRSSSKRRKSSKTAKDTSTRQCDLNVPVEWYRYNLIDAVDALEYSLSRLHKLKKEASTMYLRTRTIQEMRHLHKSLDRLLKTSSSRFHEIQENLNKEMKQYLSKKMCSNISDDDDDDVEILNDSNENDDPIFIDENSMDSTNANESSFNATHDVDLTGPASSEHNDSPEKSLENCERIFGFENQTEKSFSPLPDIDSSINVSDDKKQSDESKSLDTSQQNSLQQENCGNGTLNQEAQVDTVNGVIKKEVESQVSKKDEEFKIESTDTKDNDTEIKNPTEKVDDDIVNEKKIKGEDESEDTEMSKDLIETLLKDDSAENDVDSSKINCVDISEEFQEP